MKAPTRLIGPTRLYRVSRRVPVTAVCTGLAAAAVVVAGLTARSPAGPGWWRVDLDACVVVAVLLVGCGLAEHRLGSVRVAVVAAVGQVLGTASARTYGPWGSLLALRHGHVAALTPGLFAVVAAATWWTGPRQRRRVRVFLGAYLGMMILYSGHVTDWQNLAGAAVGLWAGWLLHRPRPLGVGRPGRRESRILVTTVLLAVGLGPVVASLRLRPAPPMTAASRLVLGAAPTPGAVRAACLQPDQAQLCQVLRAGLHTPGLTGLLLAALPVLLTLVCANGLRQGLRAAWWGAVLTQAGSALVVASQLLGGPASWRLVLPAALLLTPPIASTVLLLATRAAFTVAAPHGTARRLLLVGAGLLGAAVAVHYGLSRLRDASAAGASTPLCWVVFLVFLARVLRAALPRERATADRADARRLLHTHGGGSLGYLTLWPGQRYWFDEAGTVYVAYRVLGGVALTTGAPVGDPAARPAAVAGFAAFCDEHGLIPCFFGVDASLVDATDALGWQRLHIGDDALVALPALAFTGKRFQDIRTARNKAARAGVRAVWCALGSGDPALVAQVRAVSADWLAAKGLPELGFTLGGVEQALDPAVRSVLAISPTGSVLGVTSWLPVHHAGAVVGWTLDLMRRRADALPGTMEFLIAEAAHQFQREGALVLSLSGTPLAVAHPTSAGAADRLLAGAGGLLEPVYGFRSLLAFKAKFGPTFTPLYLTYPDAAALGAIGNAVGRAYLPGVSLRQAARVLSTALR